MQLCKAGGLCSLPRLCCCQEVSWQRPAPPPHSPPTATPQTSQKSALQREIGNPEVTAKLYGRFDVWVNDVMGGCPGSKVSQEIKDVLIMFLVTSQPSGGLEY